jgi:neutral ceramidase
MTNMRCARRQERRLRSLWRRCLPQVTFLQRPAFLSCAAILSLVLVLDANADNDANILAGAARVDITPREEDLPAPLTSVHDRIYVRALFIESRGDRAVIAVVETPAIATPIYEEMVQQIATEFDVPRNHIMLGVTHTHNSMRVAPPGPSPIPTSDLFTVRVRSGTIEAIGAARTAMRPARAGYRAGLSSLVRGREEWHASQHRYIDGIDRTGLVPVDQALGVYEFESTRGEPIAVILNYGIQPVVYEIAKTEISGDVPGATSRYVEDMLGKGVVALFTVGAPGSPAYRVWSETNPGGGVERAATITHAMGVILGEESLAQMEGIKGSTAPLKIEGLGGSLTCKGKITTPRNLRSYCAYNDDSALPACVFKDEPFGDVTLKVGALRLGDVVYVTADSNVVPALWEKLKRASPWSNTQLVSTNFGQFRFVVDDAAYALNTYPATDTRAAMGCAENGFLESALKLITGSTAE